MIEDSGIKNNVLEVFNNLGIKMAEENGHEEGYKYKYDDSTKHLNSFKQIMFDDSTKGSQLCEAYNLAIFLRDKGMVLEKKEGEKFNFNEIIEAGNKILAKKKIGKWFKWGNRQYQTILNYLYRFEFKEAENIGTLSDSYPDKETGGIQIVSFIKFLNENGFTFQKKGDTQVQLNYNKDHICIDPTIYSPTCKDLENTYRQHFTPNQEVEEEKLMDLFEENSNKKLHENWRDKLMGVCFS